MWATWNAPPERMISLSSVDWKPYAGHMQGLWLLMETWLSLTWTPWSSRQSPLRRVILSLMKNECKTCHNHTLCEPKTKRTALLKQGRKLEGADVYLDEQRSVYTARQGHILRKQHGYQIVKHSKKRKWLNVGGQLAIKDIVELDKSMEWQHGKAETTKDCKTSQSQIMTDWLRL